MKRSIVSFNFKYSSKKYRMDGISIFFISWIAALELLLWTFTQKLCKNWAFLKFFQSPLCRQNMIGLRAFLYLSFCLCVCLSIYKWVLNISTLPTTKTHQPFQLWLTDDKMKVLRKCIQSKWFIHEFSLGINIKCLIQKIYNTRKNNIKKNILLNVKQWNFKWSMTKACAAYTQSISDIICYGHLHCILNSNQKHGQKWKKWPRVALSQEMLYVQIFVRLIITAIVTNSTKNKWSYVRKGNFSALLFVLFLKPNSNQAQSISTFFYDLDSLNSCFWQFSWHSQPFCHSSKLHFSHK